MTEIYYVEDDQIIAQSVKEYLLDKGWKVRCFSRIKEAENALKNHLPSLMLLDWNMPDGSGREVCRWIRSHFKELPVIFITIRNDTADIISGLDLGADDYITKPFDLNVLYSRIRAVLRRSGNKDKSILSCSDISMDLIKKVVFYKEKEISLSRQEYRLLQVLMENQGRTITRERLLDCIWDNNGQFVNDNTLTVTMKRLRQKLNHPSCIKTVRSFGYRLEEEQS